MAPSTGKAEVDATLSKLAIADSGSKGPKDIPKAKSRQPVADSWEDEDVSEPDEDTGSKNSGSNTGTITPSRHHIPSPPPPTPISPISSYSSGSVWPTNSDNGSGGPISPSATDSGRRPEKTDAVARRMIAAGLGIKAPKQTEEQKAYQKAIKEQEKKKREQEKADEQRRREETERAKAAVWDD